MIFITESGSAYEIQDDKIQRINLSYPKRADGEWLKLMSIPRIEIGEIVTLHLESLSSHGPDDDGNQLDDNGNFEGMTIRRTSPVLKIYEDMNLPTEEINI